MPQKKKLSINVIEHIDNKRILGICAGSDPTHRVIGIWAVVVQKRVFVRSWSLKPRSWWRTFLEDPRGIIVVDGKEIRVQAIRTRNKKFKDLVSAAYKEKYNKPGDIQYVKDMSRKKSRDTTTELVARE